MWADPNEEARAIGFGLIRPAEPVVRSSPRAVAAVAAVAAVGAVATVASVRAMASVGAVAAMRAMLRQEDLARLRAERELIRLLTCLLDDLILCGRQHASSTSPEGR